MAIIGSTAPAPSAIYAPGIGTPGRDGSDGTDGRDGRDGRDGSPGQGVIFTRTASVGIPAWRALVAGADGSVAPADPSDLTHRGRVIGITARGASAGLQASIQNAGDLLGANGGFSAGAALFVGSGGLLTSTPPTSGWRQIVATAVSSSQIVVALGEARVVSDEGTALVVPSGFASPATADDVAIGEDPNKFVTPPALAPVLSEKVGRGDGLKADLPFATPNIFRALQSWLADLMYAGADLRALGFIGDGSSHPLSEKFPTLTAARAVFPRANALTEEIDGHAIQRSIDIQHNGVKPVVIRLPPGCYAQTSFPIRSGKLPTLVCGDHSFITQRTAGADGWHHGTPDTGFTAAFNATFRMKGITLACLGVGGTALYVQQDPRSGTFILDDVGIIGSGDTATNYWTRAGVGIGTSLTTFNDIKVLGQIEGNVDLKEDAFFFSFDTMQFATAQGAFIYRFNDCDISWYGRAYNFEIPRTIEGIWIERGNVNSCRNVLRANNSTMDNGGGYSSPQYFVSGLQAECFSTYFEFRAIKYAKISKCLFLVNGPKAGISNQGAYLWDFCLFGDNCSELEFTDNDMEFFAGCHPRWLFNVGGANTNTVNISGNTARWSGDSAPSGLINFGDVPATGGRKREFDNVGFTGYSWSVSGGTAQRAGGNFSESAIVSALGVAGAYRGDVADTLVSVNKYTGAVTITGTRSGVPTSGVINADFPANVFASMPRAVLASFGDTSGVLSGEGVAPVLAQVTATRIPFAITNYSGTAARRVSFQAIG